MQNDWWRTGLTPGGGVDAAQAQIIAENVVNNDANLMRRSTFDADLDDIVDNSERLTETLAPLTITTNGQVNFTLPGTPLQPAFSDVRLNGQVMEYGTDWMIAGTQFTWLSVIPLETTDTLVITYR